MSHYNHLTILERENIFLFSGQGLGIRMIAEKLGRDPSTVSRELRRNRKTLTTRRQWPKSTTRGVERTVQETHPCR